MVGPWEYVIGFILILGTFENIQNKSFIFKVLYILTIWGFGASNYHDEHSDHLFLS